MFADPVSNPSSSGPTYLKISSTRVWLFTQQHPNRVLLTQQHPNRVLLELTFLFIRTSNTMGLPSQDDRQCGMIGANAAMIYKSTDPMASKVVK